MYIQGVHALVNRFFGNFVRKESFERLKRIIDSFGISFKMNWENQLWSSLIEGDHLTEGHLIEVWL